MPQTVRAPCVRWRQGRPTPGAARSGRFRASPADRPWRARVRLVIDARIANPTAVTTSGSSITRRLRRHFADYRSGRAIGRDEIEHGPTGFRADHDRRGIAVRREPSFDDAEVQRVEPVGEIEAPTSHRDDHAEELRGQVRRSNEKQSLHDAGADCVSDAIACDVEKRLACGSFRPAPSERRSARTRCERTIRAAPIPCLAPRRTQGMSRTATPAHPWSRRRPAASKSFVRVQSAARPVRPRTA